MLFKNLLVGLMATAVSAKAIGPQRMGCTAPQPTQEDIENVERLRQLEGAARREGNSTYRAPIVVPTYFHVVASAQNEASGWVTDKQLADQFDVLNADFAPHGISFDLIETTRTINSVWASDSQAQRMKQELRKGGYDALNLYFIRSVSGGAFGYCYYPTANASPGSSSFIQDGCTILSATVPGGSIANFNLGKTVTHEVGHWLYLYHTFEGTGCSEPGDYVDDTPTQASSSSGCPIGRNSCPNLPGVDPIHNYMDYSNDPCYEEFTPGQEVRMHAAWTEFRA